MKKLKRRFKWRNTITLAVILLSLFIVSLFLTYFFTQRFLKEVTPATFLYYLINAVVFMILSIVALVIYGFIRLQYDYRRGKPGVIFQRRLLFAFIGLAMVPVVLLTLLPEVLFRTANVGLVSSGNSFGEELPLETLLHQANEDIDMIIESEYLPEIQSRGKQLQYNQVFYDILLQGSSGAAAGQALSVLAHTYMLDYIGVFRSTTDGVVRLAVYTNKDHETLMPLAWIPDIDEIMQTNYFFVSVAKGLDDDYMQYSWHVTENGFAVIAQVVPKSVSSLARNVARAEQELISAQELQRPARGGSLILLISSILVIMLISIIMSYFYARTIAAPIMQLAEATKRVAAGDLDFEIPYKPRDELKILVNSFNKMTKELQASKHALIHSERVAAWSEIARRIAHEIKNPLTPIQLSAERLRHKYQGNDTDYTAVLNSCVDTITKEVESLKGLVKEFSEFARMPQLQLQVEDINSIINETLLIYSGMESGIRIECELQPGLPLLSVDKKQIKQVIVNLINNSNDAIDHDGVINIKTYSDKNIFGNFVYIQISDNGSGIPEDYLDKIFEPYFSQKKDGAGLGLSIVNKIVNEHHAKIRCESVVDKGTTFTLEFPV